MKTEIVPCRIEINPETGEMLLIPEQELNLRPGESATFTGNPPQAVVRRVWFGRRWWVAGRAYLAGMRGPNLSVKGE